MPIVLTSRADNVRTRIVSAVVLKLDVELRFGIDLQHSTADNLLNAHRGYQIAFHTEQAGRIVPGTFNYYSLSVDGRHYLPLGDRFVVATRLQMPSRRPFHSR